MSLWQLIILAIIQGLTEFLPISSSAHLILPSQILGWPDQGPMIDVMAHFGTLFAVMAYFRSDVIGLLTGTKDLLKRNLNAQSMLVLNLLIATPPALFIGAIFHLYGVDQALRSTLIIACTTIVFGIVLWLTDVMGPNNRRIEEMRWSQAFWIGMAQALALIPGTSRAGITMSMARSLGFTRTESARFSMLMSLPIIGVGGLFSIYKLSSSSDLGTSDLGTGLAEGVAVGVIAFLVAYISIAFFMRFVERVGMLPFMIYRLILGAGLLVWMFKFAG